MSDNVFSIELEDIRGQKRTLDEYRGRALLVVNTASKCGFTPQLAGLQKLHEKWADKGLRILGFPCNQFLSQEPGNEEGIEAFCSLNYGVDFPMFSKIEVNGPNTHPLFRYLKENARGLLGTGRIKWNFTKFLLDGDGQVIARYSPQTKPSEIEEDIQRLLETQAEAG